ncbi:hypothetical protein Agub_g1487, partial [Astrephomene gubernaculifera]
ALERLLSRGFVFAGRLYRYLLAKGGSIWCAAVRSARTEDRAAWEPLRNPITGGWPLLGAAVHLTSVQSMAMRAELWASRAVPLGLPAGWTVRYEPDLEATDPRVTAGSSDTPQPAIKLTDGAGRASLDLWPLIHAAWARHRAAAAAAAADSISVTVD